MTAHTPGHVPFTDLPDCDWVVNMETESGETRRVTVRADSEQGACFAAEEGHGAEGDGVFWVAISARPRVQS